MFYARLKCHFPEERNDINTMFTSSDLRYDSFRNKVVVKQGMVNGLYP